MYTQFALAELLHMTVEELREQMSASEFIGWLAYLKIKKDRHDAETARSKGRK